ncbi:YhdP family protein [Propionivibrio limicola]|uniref:YhdP family protein n=1 Tax=Propionivibrio limicola TaxID=167645 RepID=UPI001290A2F8|nr:YhdP family protein [Propionivibrio limicola]
MTRENGGRGGLRAALYHRFHAFLPLCFNRWARGLLRALGWASLAGLLAFIALVLALRYAVLPRVEDYRPEIERLASERMGQPVSIGGIQANWEGLHPDLILSDVSIADGEGRPALALSHVKAVVSWWSVPSWQVRLRLLQIDEPTLHVRRDVDGRFFIAGIPLDQEQSDSDLSGWLLDQRRIRINGAMLVWEDGMRAAPPLILEDVNLALDNEGRRHRFGLTALPPEGLASKIDIRGDFRGSDLTRLDRWSGDGYVDIGHADLAVWRQWVDYPVELPRGRGALRVWAGFDKAQLRELTADVALRDVNLRLAPELPALDLEHLSGRLSAKFAENGFDIEGRDVMLAARKAVAEGDAVAESPAVRLEPMRFHVVWQPDAGEQSAQGSATANQVDLGALAVLSAYVPLDASARQTLEAYGPRGRLSELSARWKTQGGALKTYALKTRFDDLALKPQGGMPGFAGIAGTVDATDKGGTATLLTGKSSFDLPAVFPVPLIELDSLNALAKWSFKNGELEAELLRAGFAGPEAAGSAQGTYRSVAGTPGVIDMTAALTRADARAVWRYLPRVVGDGARYWLRDSLLAGNASEAKLTLKGNLADFPFLDKRKGQFLVTVKARDVLLDYGKGWPRINAIHGDLRFEGNGMSIEAQRGSILGAKLSNTHVEIPDFDLAVPMLHVRGKAEGPTAEFLKFIDQSPVAERINRFTEDMRAVGNGQLDINLTIPLAEEKLDDSEIEGTYRFLGNEVTVDPALPPLRQVKGSLRFSGSDLNVPEINATLLGGPLRIQGGTQKDGRVLISANGSVSVAQLRKQADHPLLASLGGAASYRGEVRINKRNADVVIESGLVGLSSALPEPFNKPATATLPLRFEKKLLPEAGNTTGKGEVVERDQINVSLGNGGNSLLSMQLLRRKQAGVLTVERGAIAIGRAPELPASGVVLAISAGQLDLDVWRALWRKEDGAVATNGGDGAAAQPPSQTGSVASFINAISLKTPDLHAFGHRLRDVDLLATAAGSAWRARLSSRQASGDVQWDPSAEAGGGKLTARLKQMRIDPSSIGAGQGESVPTETLPAVDFVADDFQVGPRRFGRIEVQARNEGGVWLLDRIQASNPDGTLNGSGQWRRAGGANRSQLAFKLTSGNVGKLLERMDYPGTLRGGTAVLEGKLGWNGSPVDLDYASLSGDMKLDAGKGQFVKLDPGAAGKLLGLISLQGLPRRISLDFGDVFSDGFAFDSVTSKIRVDNGVMRTERLQIDGPSARVLMRGEVDLKRETQRLNVTVQPELGGTAALGVGLVNPVAGVATLLAHKVLQNPLNQMFGFEYLVTGTWDDPKVEKAARSAPVQTDPAKPDNPTGAAHEPSAK